MPGYPNLSSQIQNLSGDAARLLLVLLASGAAVSLHDLPALIERAGLVFDERNRHGKNGYARAFQQLRDRGFLDLDNGTMRLRFEIGESEV